MSALAMSGLRSADYGEGEGEGLDESDDELDAQDARLQLTSFVRRALALSAQWLPADASALPVARELLAVVGVSPALAHGLSADLRVNAMARQLTAMVASELARLRASGATGGAEWTAERSQVPFGALAPLRASALLRACAGAGGEAAAQAGGAGLASAELVARCDASEFAISLASVLHAAGAAFRLRASCDRGAAAESVSCSLAAEFVAPRAGAGALDAEGGGGPSETGCRGVVACEWVLLPASLLSAQARAANELSLLAACREGPNAGTAAADGTARGAVSDSEGRRVWVPLEWGAQPLSRLAPADKRARPLWMARAQRRSEGLEGEKAATHVYFATGGDEQADAFEAEQGCATRVWLACEGCAPPAEFVDGGGGGEDGVCLCRVESADEIGAEFGAHASDHLDPTRGAASAQQGAPPL
ncbi:hypothetical protein T492DRAFT_285788 [Pavlovales sp. CCMP2436]|nr:hypothetical protein T492DRAFT_285788 [Pavlovales sp. CCMP2436]